MEFGYKKEVREIKNCKLCEFNTLQNENRKPSLCLDVVQTFNAVYTVFLFPVLAFQNKALIARKKNPMISMNLSAFWVFLDLFVVGVACQHLRAP